MNDVNCYERLVTAALASLLGVCAFLATAKFVRSCVQVLSLLLRAQGSVFALLLGSMAAVAVIEGTAKLTNDPPSQVQQHGAGLTANAPQGQDGGAPSRRRGDAPPYRTVGSRVPRDRNAGNWPGQITDEDITNGWRAVGGEGSVAPVEMPSGAVTNDLLRRRGGGDWAFRVAPEGWSFPCRGGFVEGVTVLARGEVRIDARTPHFPVPIAEGVSLLPMSRWGVLPNGGASVFSHAVTDYGSLLLDWRNALAGRSVNNPTNMQLEIFGDGSFEWRTDDSSQLYAPVFPFDWDGDGLENSVDPEPLVAGPDAHGANVEWYNVVCSNVFEAAESGELAVMPVLERTIAGPRDLAPPGISLAPRAADVNTNAYYFVEVVASRGPAPIYFTADRESRLGSPVVVARGGETNYVPLLIGVEYAMTSTVPLTMSAPDNAVVTMHGLNDGRSFTVKWPLNFVFEEQLTVSGREYDISVEPVDPGGIFSWEASHTPRLLSSETECCCMAKNGRTVVFNCSQNCSCRGDCGLKDFYVLENAMFDISCGQCRCGFDDPQPAVQPTYEPMAEASISVGFDKSVVIFESAFEERPGRWRNRRSTRVRLTVSVHSGPLGGTVFLSHTNLGKMTPVGGEAAFLPPTLMLGPDETFFTSGVYEGCEASGTEEDVVVSGSIVDNMGHESLMSTGKLTVVRAEVRPQNAAPDNECVNRHKFGVREIVDCECFPKLGGEQWVLTGGGADDNSPEGNMRAESSKWVLRCPLTNTTSRLEVSHGDVVYRPIVAFVEPDDVEVGYIDYRFVGVRYPGMAGSIAMGLDLFICPKDVNFEEIALEEVPWTQGGESTGYYALPEAESGRYHDSRHGAGKWHNVTNGNFWAVDRVGYVAITNWSEGCRIWDNPIGWNIKNRTTGDAPIKIIGCPDKFQVRFELDEVGTMTIYKFGHNVSRELSPSTETELGRVFLDGVEQDWRNDIRRWLQEIANGDERWILL